MLGIGKRGAAAVAMAASVALALAVLLQASPAKAAVGPRLGGGWAETYVSCNPASHYFYVNPRVTMDSKYYRSQDVGVHVRVWTWTTDRGWVYTDWRNWRTISTFFGTTYYFQYNPDVPFGYQVVDVWYGWYTTSGWEWEYERVFSCNV